MFGLYEDCSKWPFFIAEIGINHNGDLDLVKKMIDVAVEAGCDAVKFQKRDIDTVYTSEYLDSLRDSPWGTTQREQKEGLEFGKVEYDEIDRYCKEKGILWSASAWDLKSQEFLRTYDVAFNKIASAMLTHLNFLKEVAAEGKHTFISTGMSSLEDVKIAIEIFRANSCPVTLLHCVSTYPCEDEDCNLNVVTALRTHERLVGYSGHERGILPTFLAVATKGAVAIERHITLDKNMYGSDQSASLEPSELKELVEGCKNIGQMLGFGAKRCLDAEIPIAKKLRYFEN